MSLFQLEETLTYDIAQTVCEAGLLSILDGADQINCQALRHFDSSALAVFLCWQSAAKKQGRVVHMHHIPAAVIDLAKAYGVSGLCFGSQET